MQEPVRQRLFVRLVLGASEGSQKSWRFGGLRLPFVGVGGHLDQIL